MKRVFILISSIVIMSYVCNAQIDTTRKTFDSTTIKANAKTQIDSASMKNKADTIKYALLYVYRPRNYVGSLISYDLNISNALVKESKVGRVNNNSKFVVKLYQEGKIQIFAQTESKRAVNIDVKYGKKYYLKCGLTMGILVGRPELNLIYPEQGELDYDNVAAKEK
jgi:hypothetical protein